MLRSRHGLTLIELLVAMGIAVLLAAVVFAIYAGVLRTLDSQSRWRAHAYPASAALAVRVHPLPAGRAGRAGRDARDQHLVAGLDARDPRADLRHDAHAFVAKDAPGRHLRNVAFEDVQICAADRRLGDLHDRIARRLSSGTGRSSSAFWPGP